MYAQACYQFQQKVANIRSEIITRKVIVSVVLDMKLYKAYTFVIRKSSNFYV